LEEEGYIVATAYDGKSAFGMAQAGRFDLILLDVMLPGMDGFQVAPRLRREGNRVPILMLRHRLEINYLIRSDFSSLGRIS
jgi:DNA-binding response OmpR family regulator